MRTIPVLAITLWMNAAMAARGADEGVFRIEGRGVEGRPPYRGGGALRFLDASLDAQVVHYDQDEDQPRLLLPLRIQYDVLEPAPILLTSRMGTEYWRLYSFEAEGMSAMYTDEKIDLAQQGKQTAKATLARFGASYGPLPKRGLVGMRGHYYFLIDRPDRKWIDVTDPPPFFDRPEIGRKLTFTLADLSEFSLSIPEIQSTWEPAGPLRVRVTVTDARGHALPVVNVPLTASAGEWRKELATEWGPLSEPTGWIGGTLPDEVPGEIQVQGTVAVQTPAGLQQHPVTAAFRRGQGRISAEAFKVAEQGYELPRNQAGVIRETRAVWVSTSDVATSEGIDELVERCAQARLNMIVADIFVRNTFMAKSPLIPISGSAEEGLDPLGYLIQKAHAAGLEVHPWFCVTYRDRNFRKWFAEKHGANVDMIDQGGEVISLGADVHRPEYRTFVVDLMAGVARDYEVDGIHLDYIRSMGQCYCAACRSEFARQFGKPLTDATDDEWTRWQRRAIGEIVERTAAGVRRARPRAVTSAAVFSNMRGGAMQGQDPAGWARNGWMDLVIPMDYQMQTLAVRSNERQFLAALDEDDKLATGLSLYMRSGREVMPRPPELVREQIELVRRMGVHGYSLFAYGHLSHQQLEMLRSGPNSEPAVPFFR